MKRVFAFIGFTSAITLFVLNFIDYSYSTLILGVCIAGLVISLLVKRLRQAKVLPTVFGSAVFACLIFITVMSANVLPQKALDGETVYCEYQIVSPLEKTDGGMYGYTVKTSRIQQNMAPQNIRVKLYSREEPEADCYDYITGNITFYSVSDTSFNSHVSYGDGIYLRGYAGVQKYTENARKPINYYLIRLRESLVEKVGESVRGDDEAALACSIFLADREFLSDEVTDSFRISGMSHLLAVSGIHVAIIYFAVRALLFPLNKKKYVKEISAGVIVFGYIAMIGFPKSAVRAGIMILIMLAAKILNRRADTLNSLGLACFVLCLNPFAVTDPSAIMTVSAILGLVCIYPNLTVKSLSENAVTNYIQKTVFAFVSVVLATLPALWLFFGRVSLAGVLANFIAIPLTQVALISIPLTLVFGGAYIPFGAISALSLKGLLRLADFIAENFSSLYFDIDDFYFGVMLAAAIAFAGICIIVVKKPSPRLVTGICIIIIIMSFAFSYAQNYGAVTVTLTQDGAVIVDDGTSVKAIDASSRRDDYLIEKLGRERADCEEISIDGNFNLTVYNYVFEISDDYVTIGNTKVPRDINGKFSQECDYVFTVKENREIIARRVENG